MESESFLFLSEGGSPQLLHKETQLSTKKQGSSFYVLYPWMLQSF